MENSFLKNCPANRRHMLVVIVMFLLGSAACSAKPHRASLHTSDSDWTLSVTGANQTNIVPIIKTAGGRIIHNYICVQDADSEVTVMIGVSGLAPGYFLDDVMNVTWSGGGTSLGNASDVHGFIRDFSKATATLYHVTTQISLTQYNITVPGPSIDIYVVWATVSNLVSGQTPAGAAHFGALYDGTENLGKVEYTPVPVTQNGQTFQGLKGTAGKMVSVAKLAPTGTWIVAKLGWVFRRDKLGARYNNGEREWRSDVWAPDDGREAAGQAAYSRNMLDKTDQMYFTDGPNLEMYDDAGLDKEAYINFRCYTVRKNGAIETVASASGDDAAGWFIRERITKPPVTVSQNEVKIATDTLTGINSVYSP